MPFDQHYESLSVEQSGEVVMLHGSPGRDAGGLMSAVDVTNPLRLVLPYTKSLFCPIFFVPRPRRILTVGLGGGAFQRAATAGFPGTLVQTIELDLEVVKLAVLKMGFNPTPNCPVSVFEGRKWIAEERGPLLWDWIVLDVFRGLERPSHMRTREFYRECARRLHPEGVICTNILTGQAGYGDDLLTLASVFPQVVLFGAGNHGTGNVIAVAMKKILPAMRNQAKWAKTADISNAGFSAAGIDFELLRLELLPWPDAVVDRAKVLTDPLLA